MSPPQRVPRSPPGEQAPPVVKRPWQPPRVRTGHLFESNSLACGKSTPQLEQCSAEPHVVMTRPPAKDRAKDPPAGAMGGENDLLISIGGIVGHLALGAAPAPFVDAAA